MTAPRMKIGAIVFEPVLASSLPSNSLYTDSGSLALSSKSNTGATEALGASVASADTVMTKIWHNTSGFDIQAGRLVAKKSDGSICDGDADVRGTAVILGTSVSVIVNNTQGAVRLYGANLQAALTGMGMAPGDSVYLAVGGGYTNDLSSISVDVDEIIRVGYADCPAGVASSTATDLIMILEVISFK